jgi:hypothetical protein
MYVCVDLRVLQGELEEHEKIVSALREVDIVISALAYPQVLDQLKIIDAIKVAGNIKVIYPTLASYIYCPKMKINSLLVYFHGTQSIF